MDSLFDLLSALEHAPATGYLVSALTNLAGAGVSVAGVAMGVAALVALVVDHSVSAHAGSAG